MVKLFNDLIALLYLINSATIMTMNPNSLVAEGWVRKTNSDANTSDASKLDYRGSKR